MGWTWTFRNRLWRELRQTGLFWLSFVGPIAAAGLARFAGHFLNRGLADQVRYFGTWLQMFGIALVATGIRQLRREFNRPSLLSAMRARVSAILQSTKRQHYVINVGAGVIGVAGASVEAYGRVVAGTIEQRLDGIEREIDALRKEMQERRNQVENKLADLQSELGKEKLERGKAHSEIKRQLDNVAVGGLYLDVIGLFWLLLATVATNVPSGVAWIAHGGLTHLR